MIEKLRELLDMKQQQSGIIEAKAAIRRADESVVQGRSIVVFTVVTIFFVSRLPVVILQNCLSHYFMLDNNPPQFGESE